MAHYLVQTSYSAESTAAMVKNPEDRSTAVRSMVESLGGKLEALYFAFGESDVVVIVELPDNVSAAALSMAVGASGALSGYKTTVLMTPQEAQDAMRKAGSIAYRRPGGA
jgi:uncharacterized protein with GYD domain